MSKIAFYILSALLLSFPGRGQQSTDIPKPAAWVSDFANVFTSSQINHLDSMISIHERKTSNEVAVVTLRLDSTSISSEKEFQEFSVKLFNKWGIGKKGKNNGAGFFFSPRLKYLMIEIGQGLGTKLTNAEAQEIIDTIILPEFKRRAFFEGIVKGLEAVFREISE